MKLKRISVVGDGNSDVGTKTATRKPRQALAQGLIDRQDSAKLKRPRISGAMQQQCGDSSRGNQSALQKFVQLVGYRDPNARPVKR
jgi:hypothetical protein